jgi:DNA-binding NarL/FixJ family response regulator
VGHSVGPPAKGSCRAIGFSSTGPTAGKRVSLCERRILVVTEKKPLTSVTNLHVRFSEKFTEREMSILRLVAFGFTNIQIGEKLHISKYTVAQHIAKMLRRFGAANRTDLVNRAHAEGILQSHVTE